MAVDGEEAEIAIEYDQLGQLRGLHSREFQRQIKGNRNNRCSPPHTLSKGVAHETLISQLIQQSASFGHHIFEVAIRHTATPLPYRFQTT